MNECQHLFSVLEGKITDQKKRVKNELDIRYSYVMLNKKREELWKVRYGEMASLRKKIKRTTFLQH
jgi:hypothetical protein